MGAQIPLPGIDLEALARAKELAGDSGPTGIEGLLDMFTGGAFSNVSVFMLGIMPYISASIVIQLLGMGVPYFQKLQREGESGRKKIPKILAILTFIIFFLN